MTTNTPTAVLDSVLVESIKLDVIDKGRMHRYDLELVMYGSSAPINIGSDESIKEALFDYFLKKYDITFKELRSAFPDRFL